MRCVASDGSIEWMCLPHFDSPSIFGALLDRGAGSWRVGPYGIYVPAGRRYIPGTNIIETTWMTPQGWLRVVEALTIGPWHDNKHGSSHTRPPTDYDADHLVVRIVECIQGQVQVEIVCEPMLDYGATPASWSVVQTGEEGVCMMDATDEVTAFRLFSDIRMGIEGNRAHGRHTMSEGERRFCALSWTEGRGGPHTVEQAEEHMQRTSALLAHVARRRHLPGPSVALPPAALGAGAEGADVHAHGRARGGATTSLPETPHGERNWDYRYCWMRDASFTLWGLHALGLNWEADDFVQYVADMERNEDGSLQIMYGIKGQKDLDRVDARAPQGLRGRAPGARRQRRLQPAPERRLRSGARLGVPALQEARSHPRAAVAGAGRPGALRGGGVEGARPGHLGGARRAPPLRLLEADVLGRDGPRRAPGRTARAMSRTPNSGRRSPMRFATDILERGRRQARRLSPALRHRRARRLDAARAAGALPARRMTSACAQP